MNKMRVGRVLISLFVCLSVAFTSVLSPVQAQQISYPAQINKEFTPISITAGGQSILRVRVFNNNDFALTLQDPGWTDPLPAGVSFDGTPSTDCPGTGSITIDGQNLVVSGYTVPARSGATPGQCLVEVPVTAVAGTFVNTIGAGVLDAYDPGGTIHISNTDPASATLTAGLVQPPSLSKSFNPNTMWAGATSQLTIRITNNDLSAALTEASLTDTLPAGVYLVSGPVTGCGGTVSYPDGADTAISGTSERTIQLTGGTIPANSSCTIVVTVSSATQGSYPNTIPAGPDGEGSLHTRQGVTNTSLATSTLNVQTIGLLKAYSPTTFTAGETSLLTITLQNPTGVPYTNASVADVLAPALVIVTSGSDPSTTCGGTFTANPGESTFSLVGGTIPASTNPPTTLGTCFIRIPVTTANINSPAASYPNTIAVGDLTSDNGGSNPAAVTATVSVRTALTGSKSFTPSTLVVGNPATVRVTLTNQLRNSALTGVTFTDTLPSNLTVYAPPASPQCGGTISNTANTVTLTNGTIAVNSNCTIDFQVVALSLPNPATFNNTIPAENVTTIQGVYNIATITSNNLTVVTTVPAIGVTKTFVPASISPGVSTRLRFALRSPTDSGISGLGFSDDLPAGMTVVSAVPNQCGGTVTAIGSTVTFSGGSITNPNTTCNVDVYVTAAAGGQYPNTIAANTVTAVSTVDGSTRTNTAASTATLNVTTFQISKSFTPTTVNPNGVSTLVISLTNAGPEAITNVYVNDPLPSASSPTRSIRVAPTPNQSTTCGGTITFPTTSTIRLTGGTIPAAQGGVPGLCTISVDVQGIGGVGTLTNTISTTNAYGDISSGRIYALTDASAVLTIGSLSMRVSKGFIPNLVYGGTDSTLSVTLINPNSVPLTGIAFSDTMPAGMIIADPVNPSTGTCGGVINAVAGAGSFSFSGGYLPPSSSCTVSLRATMTVIGNLTNTIPAGGVTTLNGVSSPDAVSASLSNFAGASVSKSFGDNAIDEEDNYSMLTITIKNINDVGLTSMGLTDQLPGTLPAGLVIAGDPAPVGTTDCGAAAILTAEPGTQQISLATGSLAALGSCTIQVPVTSTEPGTYVNTIPAGNLTNGQGVTNTEPAEDTLEVRDILPALTVTKTGDPQVVEEEGGDVIFTYTVRNDTAEVLTLTALGDDKFGELAGDADCYVGMTLAPAGEDGDSCSFEAVFSIPAGEAPATHENTFTAGVEDDDGNSASDTENEVIEYAAYPAITLTKIAILDMSVVAPVDQSDPLDTITYTFRVENTGNVELTEDIIITDPLLPDLACTISAPLAEGETRECDEPLSGNVYLLTEADIEAGQVTNTALASTTYGDEPVIDDDEERKELSNWSELTLEKRVLEEKYSKNDVLHYTYLLTNTGAITLYAPFTVADDHIETVTCPDTPLEIRQGESLTCTGEYTVTNDDMANETIVNRAIASAVSEAGITVASNEDRAHVVRRGGPPGGGVDDPSTSPDVSSVNLLPESGFSPGVVTPLDTRAAPTYLQSDLTLQIARLGVEIPILGVHYSNGQWDVRWLRQEAGWLTGTAYPAAIGNSVLTAHVYLPSGLAGPFKDLAAMRWGDPVVVQQGGLTYTFAVREVRRVTAASVSSVLRHENEHAWLTLLTCQGYNEKTGTYDNRILVRAVLVSVK